MSLTLILLAGAAFAVPAFVMGRRLSVREPVYHVCRCRSCGQKLRYLAGKAGRVSMCPRCQQFLTLPATPQELSKERYLHPDYLEKAHGAGWRPARLTIQSIRP